MKTVMKGNNTVLMDLDISPKLGATLSNNNNSKVHINVLNTRRLVLTSRASPSK